MAPLPRPRPGAAAWAGAAAVAALVVTAAVIGRDLWFFSDDWNILADYHSGNLLEPFNGHLSLLPAGIYQALFHTAGLGSYVPYRLCGLIALGILGFQVLRYARTRVPPWAAVVAVAAVIWNSSGTTNVLFPFLMNFSLPVAALVAIWWHLDRAAERTAALADAEAAARTSSILQHDAWAGAWLAVALASSGLGVMAMAAVILEMAVTRAPLRRWAAFTTPVVLWLAWWVTHREATPISTDLAGSLSYAVRMLWGGTTALAAGWSPAGLLLGAAFVALVVVAVTRWRSLDGRALGALAAPLAFVGLTALTRLDVRPRIAPDELRYGWTVGAYLVLAALALWPRPAAARTTGTPAGPRWVGPAAGALAAVVLLAGARVLIVGMHDWAAMVSGAAPGLRSNLYAAEAAGPRRVDRDEVMPLSFVPVTAGQYLAAVADVGSPLQGATTAEIGGRADQRRAADGLFFGGVRPRWQPSPGAVGVPPAGATCAESVVASPGTTVLVVGNEGGGGGQVDLSRFDPDRTADTVRIDPAVATSWRLRLPADATVGTDAPVPYRLVGRLGAVLCPLADPPR